MSGKKKTAKKQTVNKDFNVEYAKSGRAVCCGCQDKIVKVRLVLLFLMIIIYRTNNNKYYNYQKNYFVSNKKNIYVFIKALTS